MVITSAPLTLAAGSRGPVAVQLEDAYGNPGADLHQRPDDRPGDDQLRPAPSTRADRRQPDHQRPHHRRPDSATVYYGDTQAGTPTVTASDPALSSSRESGETVVPAAADHFVVTTCFASPDVAGTAGTVTVTA